jgi:hypothetical protein
MTFWDFLTNLMQWLEGKTTRIIALALGTVTALTGTGIIPEKQLKYYAAAITVLTYWRAQAVSKTVDAAKAIVVTQAKADAQVLAENPQPKDIPHDSCY